MDADPATRYSALLSRLEELEAKLLAWGVVEGSFTLEELLEVIGTELANFGEDDAPQQVLDELLDRHLLFEFKGEDGADHYRTRMAESVRLFARLRQIRPWNSWQTAPTLVADFRFGPTRRLFPKRNISAEQALTEIKRRVSPGVRERRALEVMLGLGTNDAITLADFQLASTTRMLSDLKATSSRAMIVGAGTGTGKTKAFYLPALSHIIGLVQKDNFWTKALAIYPRNELLKDQFSETYLQVERLNVAFGTDLPRRIRIGVLFQFTPYRASLNDVSDWRRGQSYICPSLRCPRCEGEFEWKVGDIEQGREVLVCLRCGFATVEGDLLLTRQSLQQTPPDVLFSTTEMLNRSISSSWQARLFGIGVVTKPQIVLLDEVHTYEGTHGAQVGNLMRRWRAVVRARMHFTGLSATLENAASFFAQLTGISMSRVVEIRPGPDLEPRGMEYQLALRGDPVSATALLSTTIQAAMLLGRVLDPRPRGSGGAPSLFGRRAYVFTDNLDIVNRLYYDLRDAEGFASRGRPGVPLAAFRAQSQSERAQEAKDRFRQGQRWLLPEKLGHNLSKGLMVRRTSSQDVGVERDADVIVATASLEVGYNDPEVGAVLQHKAPREIAAFLQRKGRAGRHPDMRPWTIVSLSDYGRDRYAYQSYDLLFSPKLSARYLPVQNRYVLRMQAAFAFMDWVAAKMARFSGIAKGSVWNDYSLPASAVKTGNRERLANRQAWHKGFLRDFLCDPNLRDEFEEYVRRALTIGESEVRALMWEPPRSIMMGLVPTILRRLETDWNRIKVTGDDAEQDLMQSNSPLPDFLPPNLFSDLTLPDVKIDPERRHRRSGPDPDTKRKPDALPIMQAMQILAPGNATRRFAPFEDVLHWFSPPNLELSEQDMSIANWCSEYEYLGEYQLVEQDNVLSVPCVRPLRFRPTITPRNVRPTSKGFLDWRSQIFASIEGSRQPVPQNSPWARIVDHMEFYTHYQNSYVTVRRFAVGAQAHVGFAGKTADIDITMRFRRGEGGQLAGVGFSQDVDGIAVRFRLPENLRVNPGDTNQEKIRSYRTEYFRYRVMSDPDLSQLANSFQLDWLQQMYLSALTTQALEANVGLQESHRMLCEKSLSRQMGNVLDVIFQTLDPDDAESDGEREAKRQKMHERLLGLCNQPIVLKRIDRLAEALWGEPDEQWYTWARQRFRATLGGALLQACQRSSAQVNTEALWLDLHAGVPPVRDGSPKGDAELEEIWITEQTLGGTGIVEEVLRRYAEDPQRFFRLADDALSPSDFELVDYELTGLLDRRAEKNIREAMAAVRQSVRNDELRLKVGQLRGVLQEAGFLTNHPVMTALQNRILRSGADEAFDDELADILRIWRAEEERLGIEVDLRVIAYVLGRSRDLGEALAFIPAENRNDPRWRYQVYSSVLWPRGNVVRRNALSWYAPFSNVLPVDRFLVLDCLEADQARIDIRQEAWRETVRQAMADSGTAMLVAPVEQRAEMKKALMSLTSDPLEIGFLYVFPQVEAVRRRGFMLELVLACREAVQ